MNGRAGLAGIFAGCLALGIIPASAFAQVDHLDALREWLRYMEEATKSVDQGDYRKAEERLKVAIKEIRPFFPETRRNLAKSYCDLARVLYFQKRYADAEPLARWALSIRDADKKAQPEAVFQCTYTLGMIQSAQKKYDEAARLLERSLALLEKNLGPGHINSVLILRQLASISVEQAKFADAERLYLRSIAILERIGPDENLDLADVALKYADLLSRLKRPDEAEKWHARALAIRDTVATKAARTKSNRARKEFQGFK